eukprot:786922_1
MSIPVNQEVFHLLDVLRDTSRSTTRRVNAADSLRKLCAKHASMMRVQYVQINGMLQVSLCDRVPQVSSSAARALGALHRLVNPPAIGVFLEHSLNEIESNAPVTRRIAWIIALKELVYSASDVLIRGFMQSLIGECQLFFDRLVEPDLVSHFVDLIKVMSERFPGLFSPHFQNAVDILLGWCLDSSGDSESTMRKTILKFFENCKGQWSIHRVFGADLLSRLILHMSHSCSASRTSGDTLPGPPGDSGAKAADEVAQILCPLIMCFRSVSLGLEGTGVVTGELIRKVAECFRECSAACNYPVWLEEANVCLRVVLEIARNNKSNVPETTSGSGYIAEVFQFLCNQCGTPGASSSQLEEVFRAFSKIRSSSPKCFPPSFLSESWWNSIRLHYSRSVVMAALEFSRAMLISREESQPNSVVHFVIDELRKLLGASKKAPNQIELKIENSADNVSVEESDEKSGSDFSEFSIPQREQLIAFHLQTLSALKGDHQGVMPAITALSGFVATVREFTSDGDGALTLLHMNARLMFLIVQILHSWRGYAPWKRAGPAQCFDSTASQLSVCLSSLRSPCCNATVVTHVLRWVEDIVKSCIATQTDHTDSVVTHTSHSESAVVCEISSVLDVLIELSSHADPNVRTSAARSLRDIVKVVTTDLTTTDRLVASKHAMYATLSRVSLCALSTLYDSDGRVHKIMQRVLEICGVCAGTSVLGDRGWLSGQTIGPASTLPLCRRVCPFPLSTAFKGPQFEQVIAHLSGSISLSHSDMIAILRTSHPAIGEVLTVDSQEEQNRLLHEIQRLLACASRDTQFAQWWLALGAVKYLLRTRLNTPLGPPAKTLEHLEKIMQAGSSGTSRDISLQRALVQTLDTLEKLVFHASQATLALPEPNKNSRLFFSTNRKVCELFFAKMRPILMESASNCDFGSAFVIHGERRLSYLGAKLKSSKDRSAVETQIVQTLFDVCLHLCSLHEADWILGLGRWAGSVLQENIDTHLSWLGPMILQASGRYEDALAVYMKLVQTALNEENLRSLGIWEKLLGCVEECYSSLSDWKQMDGILEFLKKQSDGADKPVYDVRYIEALSKFDSGDNAGAADSFSADIPNPALPELFPRTARQRELRVLEVANEYAVGAPSTRTAERCQWLRWCLKEPLKGVSSGIVQEYFPVLVNLHCIQSIESASRPTLYLFESAFGEHAHPFVSPRTAHLLRRVDKCVRARAGSDEGASLGHNYSFDLAFAKYSRLHGNMRLARRLLQGLETDFPKSSDVMNFSARYEQAMVETVDSDGGSILEGMRSLWSLQEDIKTILVESDSNSADRLKSIQYDCLMSTATLLKQINGEADLKAVRSIMFQQDSRSSYAGSRSSMSGFCLKRAAAVRPNAHGAHFAYGQWCFARADELIQSGQQKPGSNSPLPSSCSDLERVRSIVAEFSGALPEDTRASDLTDALWRVLARVSTLPRTERGEEESSQDFGAVVSARLPTILKEFVTARFTGIDSSALPRTLVKRFAAACTARRTRLISLLERGGEHFVSALGGSQSGGMDGQSSNGQSNSASPESNSEEVSTAISAPSSCVTVCLRLLHILTEYGADLSDTLLGGILNTPPRLWKAILPQLFARLSHPSHLVRDYLASLVGLVTKDSPSLVVFPILVGLRTSSGKHPQLVALAEQIRTVAGPMVDHIERTLEELVRVAVLWEDQWLGGMGQVQALMPGRVKLLSDEVKLIRAEHPNKDVEDIEASPPEDEIIDDEADLDEEHEEEEDGTNEPGTNDNEAEVALIAERYRIVMAPVLEQLDDLEKCVLDAPNTPHERSFQTKHGRSIKTLLKQFRSPDHPDNPAAMWKSLQTSFAELSRAFTRTRWKVAEVSPYLSGLSGTKISIPGMENEFGDSVNIQCISSTLSVLRTKTRPKRLVFVGEDGKRYQYLLKAREDLHLDQRIMQLLSVANRFLRSPNPSGPSSTPSRRELRARTYAVVPLHARVGLIRWVDHATPLFDVVRVWQDRARAATVKPKGASESAARSSVDETAVSKKGAVLTDDDVFVPSAESFLARVRSLLIDRGLSPNAPRADWPTEVVRRAWGDMCARTPSDLLRAQLWASSACLEEFFLKTKVFARSLAVMSMIGHIIGLGDRHLGNILADFHTGEIVHIDYNVCFDKGLRLRIPEVIPFRLSRNFENAMGLSGAEGNFRKACEETLSSLRAHRWPLLALLNTFIFDPISEWADMRVGARERRALEARMGLNQAAALIDKRSEALQRVFGDLREVLGELGVCFRDLQILSIAKTNPSSHAMLQKLGSLSGKLFLTPAHLTLYKLASELSALNEHHSRALTDVDSDSLCELATQLTVSHTSGGQPFITEHYLAECGALCGADRALLHECRNLDNRTSSTSWEHARALGECVGALQNYARAIAQLVPGYMASSLTHRWGKRVLSVLEDEQVSNVKLDVFLNELSEIEQSPVPPNDLNARLHALLTTYDQRSKLAVHNERVLSELPHVLAISARGKMAEQTRQGMVGQLQTVPSFGGEKIMNLAALRLTFDWISKLHQLQKICAPRPPRGDPGKLSLNADLAAQSPLACAQVIARSFGVLVAVCRQKIGGFSFSAAAAASVGKQVAPYQGIYHDHLVALCEDLGSCLGRFRDSLNKRIIAFAAEWRALLVSEAKTGSVKVCEAFVRSLSGINNRTQSLVTNKGIDMATRFTGIKTLKEDFDGLLTAPLDRSASSVRHEASILFFELEQAFAALEELQGKVVEQIQEDVPNVKREPGDAELETFYFSAKLQLLSLIVTKSCSLSGSVPIVHPSVLAHGVTVAVEPEIDRFVRVYTQRLLCPLTRTALSAFVTTQSHAHASTTALTDTRALERFVTAQPVRAHVWRAYDSLGKYLAALQHLSAGEAVLELARTRVSTDAQSVRAASMFLTAFCWYYDEDFEVPISLPRGCPVVLRRSLLGDLRASLLALEPRNRRLEDVAREYATMQNRVAPDQAFETSGIPLQLAEGRRAAYSAGALLGLESVRSVRDAAARSVGAYVQSVVCAVRDGEGLSLGDDGSMLPERLLAELGAVSAPSPSSPDSANQMDLESTSAKPIKTLSGRLSKILSAQNELAGEIRPLLSVICKSTDQGDEFNGMAAGLKSDIENLHSVLTSIIAESTLPNWLEVCGRETGGVVGLSDRVHQKIRTFRVAVHHNLRTAHLQSRPVESSPGPSGSPPPHEHAPCPRGVTSGGEEVATDGKSGKTGSQLALDACEERSSYALSLIRRVAQKLDGHANARAARAGGSAKKKLNVEEQVDFLICEATSKQNLSQMYEGWASWV